MNDYIPAAERTFFRTLVVGIREYTEETMLSLDQAARKGWVDGLLDAYRALDALSSGESCADTEGNTWTRNF